MNILMLAPDFLPCQGGVGVYISELIRHFPSDVNIHVLTPKRGDNNTLLTGKNNLSPINFQKNITIHYLGEAKDPILYNFSFQIRCFREISEYISKYDIDLLHSQSAMPDLFINSKNIGIPIITTVHSTINDQIEAIKQTRHKFFDLEPSEKFTRIIGPWLLPLEKHYYSSNRYFITVSNWAKSNLITKFGVNPSQIRVINNGVDSNIFYKKDFSRIFDHFPQLSNLSGIKILYLSRLIKSKGIQDFIDAIPLINQKFKLTFIIAGPGKTTPITSPNVIQLGYIPHHLTHHLYSFADFFVLPSMSENFPISILEAMSSNNVVIATNVGGIPEIIQNNYDGILIQKNNPQMIADKINYLLNDHKLILKIGLNARNTVVSNFSWDYIAKKTKTFYEEVINNENRSN